MSGEGFQGEGGHDFARRCTRTVSHGTEISNYSAYKLPSFLELMTELTPKKYLVFVNNLCLYIKCVPVTILTADFRFITRLPFKNYITLKEYIGLIFFRASKSCVNI